MGTGTDCKSLEGIMNATATAYMGASSLCNPSGKPTYLGGGGVVCQSGDKWTQNLINSACPVEPNPDDISNCSLFLLKLHQRGGMKIWPSRQLTYSACALQDLPMCMSPS